MFNPPTFIWDGKDEDEDEDEGLRKGWIARVGSALPAQPYGENDDNFSPKISHPSLLASIARLVRTFSISLYNSIMRSFDPCNLYNRC